MTMSIIVGKPGSGKTLYMTRHAYMLRKKTPDRMIYSNYPLYLPGRAVPLLGGLEDWYELNHCNVYIDEMHMYLRSRGWKENPREAEGFFSQLRKRDIHLYYVTHEASGVDKMVRDRTEYCYLLESWRRLGFFWFRGFFGWKPDNGQKFLSGWYFLNKKIASCYDTDWIVRGS